MPLKSLVVLSFVLIFSSKAHTQVLQWANKVSGANTDIGNQSVVDKFGNLYVVGSFNSSNVDFDPGTGSFLMSTAGSKDGFVAKYDANGKFVWAFRIGGGNHDEVNDIALDSTGHLVITGYFRGSGVDFDPSSSTALLNSNGESGGDPGYGGDVFVAKYDTAGNYTWAFNIGGTELGDNGTSIATDLNNEILITGYFRTVVDFDPSTSTATLSQANGTLFVAKYSSAGQYKWAFNTGQGGSIDNTGFAITSDNLNNVIVTGFFQGTNIDFNPSSAVNSLSSNGGFEFFVAKYSSAGQYVWAKSAGGSGADVGRGVTTDASNNVYVTGDYNSTSINFNSGIPANTITNNGGNDLFVVKYSASGTHLWSFGTGGNGSEFGMDICHDQYDNILITGAFTGTNTDFDPSPNTINLSSKGGNDIYAVKYNSNGNYLCSFSVGGPNNDIGKGISNFGSYSYIIGSFNGSNIDFDPTAGSTVLSSTGDDVFLTKYDWTIVPPAGSITGTSNCATNQSSLTFTATSGSGPFTLYISNGATTTTYNNIQSGVAFPLTPPPTVTTTYTLTGIKDANLCSAVTPANSVVTLSPSSIPITTSGNTFICKLDSIQLSASGGTSYQWLPTAGLNNPSIPNPKASPLVTTIYKVIVSNASGCKDSATLTVTVNPPPTISILPANASFCNGDSIQLIASGGTSYQWFPSTGLSNAAISNPKASPPATMTYRVIVTNSNGCKDSLDKVVTKNPSPTVSVSPSISICPRDSAQLSASGGVSYQWIPSIGLNNPNIATPKASPPNNTTYKVVVTNSYGCKDSATTSILLSPEVPITLGTPAAICKGDSVQLNAIAPGSTYQWSPVAGLSNATISNPKASPSSTTIYSVLVTSPTSCPGTASVTVSVNQPPSINISSNTSVCAGDSVQLNASGGNTYQWSPSNGLSNPAISSPKASPSANTDYKVIVTTSAGCNDSAFVTVSVKPKPVITITAPSTLCKGDTTQLNATGGISYQWSPSLGLSNASVPTPKAYPQTSTNYNVLVTTTDGCKDSAQTGITISPRPITDLGKDSAICIATDLTLDGTTTNASSYIWSTGAVTPTIVVNQPGVYWVKVGVNGCLTPSYDSIIVTNFPAPIVTLGNDTTICSFYTLRLDAEGNNVTNYLWSTGSRDSFILVNTGGVYSLTVDNRCGSATDAVNITVEVCADDLFFPSGFTPNKDNKNDVFKAAYFLGFNVFDYELQIFNRWGQRVFVTNDVNKGWDGKIQGKEQASAVFVWIAKYRKTPGGTLLVRKGTTTLIR